MVCRALNMVEPTQRVFFLADAVFRLHFMIKHIYRIESMKYWLQHFCFFHFIFPIHFVPAKSTTSQIETNIKLSPPKQASILGQPERPLPPLWHFENRFQLASIRHRVWSTGIMEMKSVNLIPNVCFHAAQANNNVQMISVDWRARTLFAIDRCHARNILLA